MPSSPLDRASKASPGRGPAAGDRCTDPGGRARAGRLRLGEGRAGLDLAASFLDEPEGDLRRAATAALRGAGRGALPALRRAARAERPSLRTAARRAIDSLERRPALRRLEAYVASHAPAAGTGASKILLDRGLRRLDRVLEPKLDGLPAEEELARLTDAVLDRVDGSSAGLGHGLALVEVMAGSEGFTGVDEDEYDDPRNASLTRTIERRRGLPLSLCAAYHAVGRRAGLETGLLPVPGHVLLRVREGRRRLIVDPFSGGRLLSRAQCLSHLALHSIPYDEAYLRPASDHLMLLRQVRNLGRALGVGRRGAEARALERVERLLTAGRAGRPSKRGGGGWNSTKPGSKGPQ